MAAVEEACERLEPTVTAIGQTISAAPLAHADETGMRVAGKLHWLHVLATTCLTWMGIHPNRGNKAFDAFGLLRAFVGTLVHDGWQTYRDLVCHHALCNAHHLRELTYYLEIMSEGEAANPRAPPSGKRGRTRQSKAVNLLHQLRTYADDVLRFMTDHEVPFTNNLAEQAVRMPKVKQKVSGCFRTLTGAQSFSARGAIPCTSSAK